MPKNIPVALVNQFAKRGTSTCFLIKIRTKEDGYFGFTTADFVFPFNDGFGVINYMPDEELKPQNIQSTLNMTVDNTKLVGWFKDAVEEKILSGAFDAAEIWIYRLSYLRPELGFEIVGYGTVGEVDYSSDAKDKRKVEYRSLTQQLTRNTNQLYSLTCRADFGDERCKMPFDWHAGQVQLIPGANNHLIFKVTGIAKPDDYFTLGVINFLDGQNAGADLEIESWAADGTLKLSYVSPYPVAHATQVRVRRDCIKTESACLEYNNIVNMRAEHLTPTEDQALMVPGAYIRSRGAM